jgi:Tfp pilus assembly protein PilP
MSGSMRRLLILASACALAGFWAGAARAQSGTTAGKAREKVKQAQSQTAGTAQGAGAPGGKAAPSSAPAPQQAAPAQPAPAGAVPASSTAGGMTVIVEDPNHMSAVKALEQIRRDEERSSEGNSFSYDPGDRRDPFLSPQDILQAQMSGQVCQGEGMECWLIQDVTVIGVLTRHGGNVALVIGPDGYGTTLHEGDKLYDGEVRRIDPETGLVVFRQKINDPTRIKPFRDVEKGLNLTKEGRS